MHISAVISSLLVAPAKKTSCSFSVQNSPGIRHTQLLRQFHGTKNNVRVIVAARSITCVIHQWTDLVRHNPFSALENERRNQTTKHFLQFYFIRHIVFSLLDQHWRNTWQKLLGTLGVLARSPRDFWKCWWNTSVTQPRQRQKSRVTPRPLFCLHRNDAIGNKIFTKILAFRFESDILVNMIDTKWFLRKYLWFSKNSCPWRPSVVSNKFPPTMNKFFTILLFFSLKLQTGGSEEGMHCAHPHKHILIPMSCVSAHVLVIPSAEKPVSWPHFPETFTSICRPFPVPPPTPTPTPPLAIIPLALKKHHTEQKSGAQGANAQWDVHVQPIHTRFVLRSKNIMAWPWNFLNNGQLGRLAVHTCNHCCKEVLTTTRTS